MRALLAILAVAVLASGCTGSSPAADPTSATSAAPATIHPVVGVPPTAPRLTDTLHLLTPPRLTASVPDAAQDIRIPVTSVFSPAVVAAGTGQAPFPTWSLTLGRTLPALQANATLWVDVEGAVVGNPSPAAQQCFWGLQIAVHGATTPLTSVCIPEVLQVPNGVRALRAQFPVVQTVLDPGTTLDLVLNCNAAAQPPGSTVELLTASTAHDSQVTLAGLQAGLDPASLLGATSHR
jgi:hypothetical protein